MKTLHHPDFERDSCGFGLVTQLDDQPSHQIVCDALDALRRLTHRGAVAPDGKTGDGCGVLLKLPLDWLAQVARENGLELAERFTTGMIFLDPDAETSTTQRAMLERHLTDQGLEVAGWRAVPVDPDACGEKSRQTMPLIEQIFVNAGSQMDEAAFQRALYLARRLCEVECGSDAGFYIASLSAATISYKGMVMP
ncbi:MAG: glutamate synthase large subunit, partial [Wenzhouxiangella sp.]